MEKEEENYSAGLPASYTGLDYSIDHHHQLMRPWIGENSGDNNAGMVDYMFNNPPPPQVSSGFCSSNALEKLSINEVMQFADFEPKLTLNQTNISDEENGINVDPVYFLKFPVLNDKSQDHQTLMAPPSIGNDEEKFKGVSIESKATIIEEEAEDEASLRFRFLGGSLQNKDPTSETKNRRKRLRSVKTSEEVESQRMTHIAVERNRRKHMNEHIRVLRSLMPGSYVQRGDQASIIGGAIEFVRELEQLLQCLESQKQRRLFGDPIPTLSLPNDQIKLVDFELGLHEETAKNKSCLADVEVTLLGFDALIKILSPRRPGQLLKMIASLEELQLNIFHTNITTIEQTVLYSFNVKVASESRSSAEDIANSVQQIFNFIHASSTI